MNAETFFPHVYLTTVHGASLSDGLPGSYEISAVRSSRLHIR